MRKQPNPPPTGEKPPRPPNPPKLRLLLAAVFGVAVSGCASMMSAPNLSPEQYKALAADKNLTAACLTFTGVGGTGKSVIVTLDQRVIANGGIEVDPNTCAVTISNSVLKGK